ncbi:MAG: hypothetical protein RR060_03320 [Victivallaceae bacterium]
MLQWSFYCDFLWNSANQKVEESPFAKNHRRGSQCTLGAGMIDGCGLLSFAARRNKML